MTVHRPTQYDERLISIKTGPGLGLATKIDIADSKTRFLEQRVQNAQGLVGNMLKYKYFRSGQGIIPAIAELLRKVGLHTDCCRNLEPFFFNLHLLAARSKVALTFDCRNSVELCGPDVLRYSNQPFSSARISTT